MYNMNYKTYCKLFIQGRGVDQEKERTSRKFSFRVSEKRLLTNSGVELNKADNDVT